MTVPIYQMHQMPNWSGVPVVLSASLTKSQTYTVQRTWRERLWSWPWTPWDRTKLVTVQVPNRDILAFGNRLLMHPATYSALKATALSGVRTDVS